MNQITVYIFFLLMLLGCSESFNKPVVEPSMTDLDQKKVIHFDTDLVIEGSRSIEDFIPDFKPGQNVELVAPSIIFKKNSIFFTHGSFITLTTNSFIADGSIIQTFSNAHRRAEPGKHGLPGGKITISADSASGEISFFVFGQHGGHGIRPKDLELESAGKNGRDGKTGYGYEGTWENEPGGKPVKMNTFCFVQPEDGEDGKDGKDGTRGGDGGNGGDSGSVVLLIRGLNALQVQYEITVGLGGSPSPGGLGSKGGRGGKKGDYVEGYLTVKPVSVKPCRKAQDGKDGKDGFPGPQGFSGSDGKKKDFCIKNFTGGELKCGL